MDFEALLKELQKTYYTQLVMVFSELSALIIGFVFVRKYKIGRWFIFYIAFDLTVLLIDWTNLVIVSVSENYRQHFIYTTNTLIAMVELVVYFSFFRQIFQHTKIRKALKLISMIFILASLIYTFTNFKFLTSRYVYVSLLIGVLEFVLLAFFCVLYYLQLFKNISKESLFQRPSFWIISGIFFYSMISIPFYLLHDYLTKSKYEYRYLVDGILFYIPYSVNFIFLGKSFLCNRSLTI